MKKNVRCAVIGQHPLRFPWGFDEEDDGCRRMKLEMAQRIMELRQRGVTEFQVACDPGVVLAVYAPDLADGSAEDKAVSYALALGRPVMLIHPETLKTKWLNVPTEKAPRIDCPATKITGLILWNDLHFRQGLYNKLK